MVAMLTNLLASFLPKTSPTMSVTRNRTGTKKMPTETLIFAMLVIFVPKVLTMTMHATNRAKRKSRFLLSFSSVCCIAVSSSCSVCM